MPEMSSDRDQWSPPAPAGNALLHHLPHLGGQRSIRPRDLGQVTGPKPSDPQLLDVVNQEISVVNDAMPQLAEVLD